MHILTYVLAVCSGLQTEMISHCVCFTKLFSKDNQNMPFNTLNAFWMVGVKILLFCHYYPINCNVFLQSVNFVVSNTVFLCLKG